ncbi:RraA family protein [Erwiniaceae bacterium BAC15a-03b]|uniref:Putative 4-hydroxy-4-methyl-2-oxoglutarate aldolase n=1 Tax=Winslowiella arboricola TaxID=2978220 RepID=A0A9J6PZJ1_9GAMM|nr:RraA family protein [Winslowiella arboricola]MCU5775271.1 RraA family protein [Winslowiella arboricola]MCU5780332.1 RraA family protein [Winslowiella arboricola]
MPTGFRVLHRKRKASAEQIAAYRDLPVANISDSMQRMSAGGASLRPMHAGGQMAGTALTVRCRPGDNLMMHYALNIAEPGDVIVVDAGGDLTNAITGELMLAYAAKKQLAGVVINGAVRDIRSIRANPLPVYAAGVTHRGPYKDGPGEINVTIAIDGMVIEPGDLMVGDEDGLLCVPLAEVERIYSLASERHASEIVKLQAIADGHNNRDWVLKKLQALGCELPE